MKFKLAQPQYIYELGQRNNQEDSIFPVAGAATIDSRLFIVCDGMGGHDKGEVASKTVCDALAKFVLTNVDENTYFTNEMFEDALDEAYKELDTKDVPENIKKMGTTLTFILFHKGGCFMAHIGDSRIYHVRPSTEQILYISRDHSLVFDLFRSGEIKYEEMQTHPRKNIITRAMMPGEESRVNADVANTTDILPGDYFYLCSDGMLEQMDESDILGILGSNSPDEAKQQRLISATLDNADNHSAYIIRVEDVEMEPGDEQCRNDEQTSRTNTINYIPELNGQEVTKVNNGNFVADGPQPVKEKPLFPWIKIVLVLLVLAIVGLFVIPPYLSKKDSENRTTDEQGQTYQDKEKEEEEDLSKTTTADNADKKNNEAVNNDKPAQNKPGQPTRQQPRQQTGPAAQTGQTVQPGQAANPQAGQAGQAQRPQGPQGQTSTGPQRPTTQPNAAGQALRPQGPTSTGPQRPTTQPNAAGQQRPRNEVSSTPSGNNRPSKPATSSTPKPRPTQDMSPKIESDFSE